MENKIIQTCHENIITVAIRMHIQYQSDIHRPMTLHEQEKGTKFTSSN